MTQKLKNKMGNLIIISVPANFMNNYERTIETSFGLIPPAQQVITTISFVLIQKPMIVSFYHRTARHRQGVHPHSLEPGWSRTVRFQRNFLPRTLRSRFTFRTPVEIIIGKCL